MSTAAQIDKFNRLAKHDVVLWLGASGWSGWTEVSIDRGIDTVAGAFELTLTDKSRTGAQSIVVESGMECSVTLGGVPLITGYVDGVRAGISAEARTLSIRGRDKAADLVDCSAMNVPGSWRNQRLEAIAQEIAKPFGVSIEVAADTGKPFAKFALQPGETAWAAIERMARYRGVIAWSLGDGKIRIGNPDSGQIAGQLTEGVNVLDAERESDASERFSAYTVKGQASANDNRNGRTTSQVKAQAQDAGIKRYRPIIITAEEQADTTSLTKRAKWEAQTRAARGETLQVTVPGWYTGPSVSSAIWQPGSRAACSIPSCGISATLLIERVRFSRSSESATTTGLSLVPPQAWSQLAEAEPKS